jgi:hypothetical protein
MTQWGWEFLRRRQDYRLRWERLVKPLIKDDGTWDQEAEDRQREDNPLFYVPPLVLLGSEFRIRATPTGNRYLDPRSNRPPFFEGLVVHELSGYALSGQIGPVNLPRLVLEFDVRLPAKPQFADAKERFQRAAEHWGKPPRRPQVGLLPIYLRLLDFEELRASDNEIGRYLFPDKDGNVLRDTINKNVEAARSWQADYLLIALHSPAGSGTRTGTRQFSSS